MSLVNPRVFPSGDANALSGNATDVLEKAFSNTSVALPDKAFASPEGKTRGFTSDNLDCHL